MKRRSLGLLSLVALAACDNTSYLYDPQGGNGGQLPAAGTGGTTAGTGGTPATNGGTGGSSGASGSGGLGGSSGSSGSAGMGGAAGLGGTAGNGGGGGAGPNCVSTGVEDTTLTLAGLGIDPTTIPDAGAYDPGDAGVTNDAGASAPEDRLTGEILPGSAGWATVAGLGLGTTIGGAAGQVVTATTGEQLQEYAESDEPLVIRICGTIQADVVNVSSNKTLIGVQSAVLEGGLRINGTPGQLARNVVVKNLTINAAYSGAQGSGIHIAYAHHLWIDHVDIFDSIDNSLRIVKGSDFVTVSWSKFHFTPNTPDQKHRFGILIGDSDEPEAEAEDKDHLNVTLHHNWFGAYIRQRAPRVRFGDVHVYNNYWSGAGNDYSIWVGLGGAVLLENNYFTGVFNPHELRNTSQVEIDRGVHSKIRAEGNIYDGTTGLRQDNLQAFEPPYAYSLAPAAGLPSVIMADVGPQ